MQIADVSPEERERIQLTADKAVYEPRTLAQTTRPLRFRNVSSHRASTLVSNLGSNGVIPGVSADVQSKRADS